ncbi:MAG TPA: hypothetical protein VFT68_14640 [Lapillicoccus sp.]|nr:hypothetical protein [Lapillicoccus sp.]
MYDRLDPEKVSDTLEQLRTRIVEQFPDRHLGLVATEVGEVIRRIERQASENAPLQRFVVVASRVAIVLLVALIVVAVASAIRTGTAQVGPSRAIDWLTYVESGVNDVVFAGIAVFFLMTIPNRFRRRRNLETLHRLRSLAHIVDMHQMSKSPEKLLPRWEGGTAAQGSLTRAALGRYYDYCSELLTIVSKAAALCAEQSTDPVVLDTVSEIEVLTTGMSRKIWQKISLLHLAQQGAPQSPQPGPLT